LHAPQWVLLLLVSCSQPFIALPSQSPKPALHAPILHVELWHTPVALALAHGTAQAPQLFASLRVSTSHPSPASELQSAKLGLHAISKHRPALHVALALATLHVRPQAPQCMGLAVRSCSHPLPTLPSQSPRLAMHVLSQR
jgi:hypothetical protein